MTDIDGNTNRTCLHWTEWEKRAKKLEKENAELGTQIKQLQDDIDCLTSARENYREEMEKNLADATELEKENKELKEQNRSLLESCEGATMMHKDLCKAKELVNKFMRISNASDEDFEHDYSELIGEAEQFLKEVEK